ncbi:MAG: hypothetical protein H7Y31_05675 [Chitinophagaceae bacterium]|nr:hypothetical protein [Chitinophagaceae bacterium]
MNWRIFIIVSINIGALLFPYNIIGCAGYEPDPYDYYVSFVQKDLSGSNEYEPFYYTNYQPLYRDEEPVDASRVTAGEWTKIESGNFTSNDAYQFVCKFALRDLTNLYNHLEKSQPLSIHDSIAKNSMTKFFLSTKNLEALGYIMYAKQVEPQVLGNWNEWEPVTRDSTKMTRLIKNGLQLYRAAKTDFVKMRYGYQVVRLAHYSERYKDCIQYYDELITPIKILSVLQELSAALRAGALFRTGKNKQAAYEFSQLFANSKVKRISNYLGFSWAVKRLDSENRKEIVALGKTNVEKANVLALFALGSNIAELEVIRRVYQLAPSSPMLPVLIIRELNKIEENFLSPSLQFDQGKSEVYINYESVKQGDPAYLAWKKTATDLRDFCKVAAQQSASQSFYFLTAAHAAMLAKDYTGANALLNDAKKSTMTETQLDQWQLTSLIVKVNSQKTISPAFENELLTSIQWLEKKAKTNVEFAKFYRRLFADILPARYQFSNESNSVKYILCRGLADKIQSEYVKEGWGYNANSLSDLRSEATVKQAEELVRMIESKKLSHFDKFLVAKNSFDRDDVNDVVGTAWLRQFNFVEAEKWFKKVPTAYYIDDPFKTYLAANPFADLLLDTHAPTKQDTVVYTKLSFTQRMNKLIKELGSATEATKKASLNYELAKGYYHMSYWGNSWMFVQYDWSGSEYDGEPSKYFAKQQRSTDYYTVEKAKSHYLKALELSPDKNFKAKCIYMAAKCEQKRVGKIPWYFEGDDAQKKVLDAWVLKFDKQNLYFTTLKRDYKETPFYKEAVRGCSYLRDFVR